MKILGFEISRAKANPLPMQDAFRPVWWPIGSTIQESYPGAWQKNAEVRTEDTLSYWAVFRCISIISSDIAKMRVKLLETDRGGIPNEIATPAFLKKPNAYQNRIQFVESWVTSRLMRGNTYVLKQRGDRDAIERLYVLDPCGVTPLVADNGMVFYRLRTDRLSGVEKDGVDVPASEIIHDRWNCFYHPLVGLSPIYAAGLNAMTGLRIQNNAANFFGNGSRPGGVLTAPGAITNDTAQRLKDHWDKNFTGENVGKVAVLGDGLKYEQLAISAIDAQMLEQSKWTAETIAATFGVPAHMLNTGQMPTNTNIEAVTQQYYGQCLQIHIESAELCLDQGLELPANQKIEFDLDDLLRMDTATLVKAEAEAIGAGFKSPNESRKKFGLRPVVGGEAPYLQQQNFSLEALSKRDNKDEETGGAEIQATALNGAQVTSLQGLLDAVAAGTMPADTAAAAIAAAFPLLSAQQIASMIDPLRNFTPPKPEPQEPPSGGEDGGDGEQEEDDGEARALYASQCERKFNEGLFNVAA